MKAILVIDMPKNCEECKLTYIHTRKDTRYCCLTDREVEYRNDIDNCPLKPLPPKKEHSKEDNPYSDNYEDEYEYQYREGYNTCLREITGETE